jgi:hypothetical protein
MPNLSIPMSTKDQQFGGFAWAIRMSPLIVAAILAALWMAGAPPVIPDLRLSAPLVARPGTTIGVRAWQVDQDTDGYTVILAPAVAVELRNAAGMVLAKTDLTESLVQGVEGHVQVRGGLDGVLSLVALAEIDGRSVSVERALYVRESIESRLPKGRAVNAFQGYELGPIRAGHSRRAVGVLDPRVEEGACVPELRCWLSVWVGAEAVAVRVRPLAGVRTGSRSVEPSNGFARFPLVVAGNEGRVEVEALGPDGVVVAAREVRLPVVPGGIVARASVTDGAIELEWEQLGGRDPVLVDVFEGRRWMHALSLSPDAPHFPVLGPGVWRLQVRADLFSDNTAGVAHVVVADPDGPGPARHAATAVLAEADREGLDPLAVAIIDGDAPRPGTEDLLRALFAVPSFDVVAVGAGTSARVGTDEALDGEQELRRWQAAAAILLIGLMVSMVLLRVELVAQARARQLLDELGDEAATPRRTASPGRGLWAFVLLVFVLMAVLALSKGWF